jgi:hypothetical protein
LKVSVDGLAVSVGPVTLNVTGIMAGLPAAPVEVTVTVPLKLPGVVRPVVSIETLTEPGTVVPLGVATSQVPPEGVVTAAEALKLIPDVPVTFRDLAMGAVPPIA